MNANVNPEHAAAVLVALVACGFDLRTRRIPNALTFGAAGAALLYALWANGPLGLLNGATGWLVGCAMFLPFFLLAGMGAGDVKLLAGIGAWLGPGPIFWAALYTMIAGGVMAIVVSLFTGYLRQALSNLFLLAMRWRVEGVKPVPHVTLADAPGPRLPYALPIAAGTAAALWLR
jgi:prepilin peptidase CpaA